MIVRSPPDPGAFARAAGITGLVVADVRRRLAGSLPRVLLSDASGTGLAAAGEALTEAGFGVLTCEPRDVPTDRDRVVARSLDFHPGEVVVVDGLGNQHVCPVTAIELLQRGNRVTVAVETVKSTERRFDPARAVLSGGILLTKKVETRSTVERESRQAFLLIQRRDGEPEIILYERKLQYHFLGAEMQPTSFANLQRTAERLRTAAPVAAFDDRVGRPGFVSGLPPTAVDPVDLALHLVLLARRVEA